MTVLLASAVDATVIIGIALLLITALKGRSAALRHSVLAAGIAASALSPVLELVVPAVPLLEWNAPTTVVSSGITLTSNVVAEDPQGWTLSPPLEPILSWMSLLLIIWAAGATCLLAGLVTGLVRLSRLTARCVPVSDGSWRSIADALTRAAGLRRRVEILQSTEPSLLVTCGLLRPKIILPAGAALWTEDRQRVVLVHELEHVRRGDGAIQLAAEATRALHWFNPLMALACRRLRQESEYACDDVVLNDGVEATEYATHLVGIARHVSRTRAWASAPAIAHPSTLERRISSMLNHERDRQPLTRRTWAWAATAALVVIIPLTAATVAPAPDLNSPTALSAADVTLAEQTPAPATLPAAPAVEQPPSPAAVQPVRTAVTPAQTPAQPPRAVTPTAATAPPSTANFSIVFQARSTISGTVLDETGGALPGVRMTLISQEHGTRSANTNEIGGFAFRDLLPANYDLLASYRGFATVSNALSIAEGTSVQRVITLPAGTLEETITLACSVTRLGRVVTPALGVLSRAFFPVLSAQQLAPRAVRIGGDVKPPKKLTYVTPACPSTVNAGAPTTVVLFGRIGIDGTVSRVTLVPGVRADDPLPEFVQSAVDAVRQWTFTPALVSGQPVAINMTVRILYNAK